MTKEEIFKSREKSMIIHGLNFLHRDRFHDGFIDHIKSFDFLKSDVKSVGQFFLYEIYNCVNKEYTLQYPKLGLYINSLPCDQTIEVEWIDYKRTWEYRLEYEYEFTNMGITKTYKGLFYNLPTEIKRLPLCDDGILVYGVWNSMPSWSQLKQAYERTWWFHRDKDELRDIQLNRLLK